MKFHIIIKREDLNEATGETEYIVMARVDPETYYTLNLNDRITNNLIIGQDAALPTLLIESMSTTTLKRILVEASVEVSRRLK